LVVVGVDGNLVICTHDFDLGKDGTTRKVMGIILNVWKRIPVRDGSGVQGTVVSTRPPNAVLLGYEVEGG
jgi:hypothetical protein